MISFDLEAGRCFRVTAAYNNGEKYNALGTM